ncbi:hypothetical protein [Streptomyces sp. NPDC057429]|uniref:hypothetical protein n=1 Tax=Streptomyces sp. NPDC057429 TaxID=3346130 RepID=UPI0036A4EBF3
MFLALLELRAARGRFLLMGSVVVLVAALVGIVSGFTTGLGDDTVSALRRLPASQLVFSSDARSDQFARSLLDEKTAAAWSKDADTETTPLGVSITGSAASFHLSRLVSCAAFPGLLRPLRRPDASSSQVSWPLRISALPCASAGQAEVSRRGC